MYRIHFDVIWWCLNKETGKYTTASSMQKLFDKVGISCLS